MTTATCTRVTNTITQHADAWQHARDIANIGASVVIAIAILCLVISLVRQRRA